MAKTVIDPLRSGCCGIIGVMDTLNEIASESAALSGRCFGEQPGKGLRMVAG